MTKLDIDFSIFLDQYHFPKGYVVENGDSGMNNTTRMVRADGARYVLRVYNNHKDAGIVQLEHEVLDALQEEERHFSVPVPVHNRSGSTITAAADGTLATLAHYIDGDRPRPFYSPHIYALGLTTGRMTAALSQINPSRPPLYDPYYMLDESYTHIDDDSIIELTSNMDALAASKQSLMLLHQQRHMLKDDCKRIAQLPKQWIHGDLVFNNTVAIGDHIVGVLDFEFCTVDVRIMELAVIATDLLKPDHPDIAGGLQQLFEGYRETITMSEEERELFLSLVKLRLLDVVYHFINRYNDGLDSVTVLCSIIESSAFGIRWLNMHWEDDWL